MPHERTVPAPLANLRVWHDAGIRRSRLRRTLEHDEGDVVDMRISARALAVVATLGGLALLTGCGTKGTSWHGAGDPGSASPSATKLVSVTTPTDGATNVPTAGELKLAGPAAGTASVTVTDASGKQVDGATAISNGESDGVTWLPAAQLQYATTYTVAVTASGTDGKAQTAKTTFTTMKKPGKLVSVSTSMSDNQVYGVGLPVVVRFGSPVTGDQRAAIERRLLVTSEPAQIGAWNWFNSQEVHYRPKEYWQEGTKLSVRLATGGLSFGGNAYGAKDVTVHATIGDRFIMTTDNATHTMTVTQHDQVIKTMPVSLGKAKTPSSSGNMVIMDKNQSELFVSTDPSDPYRETVYWTMRLTSGGQYIHAAPWSVGDQGKRNVSHGCTNVSTDNAKWLYGITHIGDPVIVKGTERKLTWGDGWSDWDKSWDEYVKGSALAAAAE
jgi:lipoprotein-anchoring transpeptidase ErfK/SrfK